MKDGGVPSREQAGSNLGLPVTQDKLARRCGRGQQVGKRIISLHVQVL